MSRQTLILTITLLVIAILTSCRQSEKANTALATKTAQAKVPQQNIKIENALKFINGYCENANKLNKAVGMIEWVNSDNLTTKNFKAELKRLVDDANHKYPELGLGADPILDAQDNPKSFELEAFDQKTNYLILKGKDWPDFKVTMKIKEENGNWLVDGCGIVNIPNEKRAER